MDGPVKLAIKATANRSPHGVLTERVLLEGEFGADLVWRCAG
jgi:hypothetical protein